jgi:hypothetical protein
MMPHRQTNAPRMALAAFLGLLLVFFGPPCFCHNHGDLALSKLLRDRPIPIFASNSVLRFRHSSGPTTFVLELLSLRPFAFRLTPAVARIIVSAVPTLPSLDKCWDRVL